MIWLALGGASRVLAGQNRRLQEQATTERLLLVDLRRNEERFRSLVQNASDGVVVLGEDALIRYESPAVERILGRRAEDGIGQRLTADVHPDDRATVDRRLADVAGSHGSEVAVEFRARHADGSWRTLEAIAKNLLDDPAVGASSSTTATSPSEGPWRSSSVIRRSTTSSPALRTVPSFSTGSGTPWPGPCAGRDRPRSCTWTSTTSRPSTTVSATPRATGCLWPSVSDCVRRPAPGTRLPAWVATSSR
jgi:PAS domain S-box-containing protein